MAAINDLISQIENPELRQSIQQEVAKMSKQKKFGLVFEEHLPENTPLYDLPIRSGIRVAKRDGDIKDNYQVLNVNDGIAKCVHLDDNHEKISFPVDDLIAVAQFGEPIYPYLKPIDSVCNAPDSELWHTLIQADNYHALQLLEYLYAGKVDCIYIDPPYNTGARDWKYNNDYVDSNDQYRHSKWLSMMQKRLKIAKKLLNPQDSVLIVTIDEKEYLHLGCLLEEMFPEANMQMISSVINPNGSLRKNAFSRTDEYLFFVMIGNAAPRAVKLDEDWLGKVQNTIKDKIHWMSLRRTGTARYRTDRPNLFYPIYIAQDGSHIVDIGKPIPLEVDKSTVPEKEGCITIWPLMPDGTECRWQMGPDSLRQFIENHYVRLGIFNGSDTAINYLNKTEQQKIVDNNIEILGYRTDGSIIVEEQLDKASFVPGTQWWIKSHDANRNGTKLVNSILGTGRFSFPKSLYATHDTLRFFVANKPSALIVDFFAGSGTTLHAVNLMNAEDGGKRRCIIVTNNEVSDAEAKDMTKKGLKPGDEEWEKLGIARYVTWPRTVCSIEGHDIKGAPLNGNYIGSEISMANGFRANAIYFKLGFLDKTKVSLGMQFKEMLPILWMKAGAKGECPKIESKDLPPMLICEKNHFAVLIDEKHFAQFVEKVNEHENINMIYLVVDSDSLYRVMAKSFPKMQTCQLYRDYLDNFRINVTR